jgi:hypothetical protein
MEKMAAPPAQTPQLRQNHLFGGQLMIITRIICTFDNQKTNRIIHPS